LTDLGAHRDGRWFSIPIVALASDARPGNAQTNATLNLHQADHAFALTRSVLLGQILVDARAAVGHDLQHVSREHLQPNQTQKPGDGDLNSIVIDTTSIVEVQASDHRPVLASFIAR